MTSALAQQVTVLLWDYDDTKGDEKLGRYSYIQHYVFFLFHYSYTSRHFVITQKQIRISEQDLMKHIQYYLSNNSFVTYFFFLFFLAKCVYIIHLLNDHLLKVYFFNVFPVEKLLSHDVLVCNNVYIVVLIIFGTI